MSPADVWLVDFGDPFPGEPAHHRPAVVVGPADAFGADLPFVFVVPTTTARRGLSLHVELEPTAENGLETISYAQTELLRSISSRRLVHRLGRLAAPDFAAIDHMLRVLLGH